MKGNGGYIWKMLPLHYRSRADAELPTNSTRLIIIDKILIRSDLYNQSGILSRCQKLINFVARHLSNTGYSEESLLIALKCLGNEFLLIYTLPNVPQFDRYYSMTRSSGAKKKGKGTPTEQKSTSSPSTDCFVLEDEQR